MMGRESHPARDHMSERPSESARPSPPSSEADDSALELPERVGPYRILQLIGEGGMGVVYEAAQTGPVTRRVALKVLKPGLDTKQVLARFEAERQALAVMEHPNIAKVLDAGATEAGRPYFVMELVRGIPLHEYCDTFTLSTRQRLQLFVAVCRAVQHAHQKGVIHRDLKPSNVLVIEQDDRPVPKIIDFGVAKAISQPLTERTLVTEHGKAVGTPAYMSPEQAGLSGLDVDTRTDIYSLGVVLYQLLVGALPLEPREIGGMPEFFAHLAMRDTNPPSPSNRFSSLGDEKRAIAEFRHTDPKSLVREIKRDLDWIVMKAIEKDRSRRYETANGLAMDIERYLRDEPIVARPPSTVYKIRKFVRRHRAAVAAAAVMTLALVTGMFATSVALIRASRAEAAAEREAEAAQQVSDFLVGLFGVSDPREARGNPVTAREVLDRGAAEITEQLDDQPIVQARLMATMGEVYTNMGLFDEARPLLDRALAIREATLGPDHLDVAESLAQLAWLLRKRGEFGEAEPLLGRAVQIQEALLGPDHPDVAATLASMGANYMQQRRYDEAEPLLRRALTIREKTLGFDDPAIAGNVNNLGTLFYWQRRYADAEPFFERSVAINEQLGPDHPRLATSLNNLGALYFIQEKYQEAERAYERARQILEKTLEPDHPDIAAVLNNLAEVYWKRGSYADAEDYFRRSLAIKERVLRSGHPSLAITLQGLANVYRDQARYRQAEPLYERALEIRRSALQSDDPDIAETLENYAKLLRNTDRISEAEKLEAEAATIRG